MPFAMAIGDAAGASFGAMGCGDFLAFTADTLLQRFLAALTPWAAGFLRGYRSMCLQRVNRVNRQHFFTATLTAWATAFLMGGRSMQRQRVS